MKLFDRLKRRRKNDEAFKEVIQRNLDVLAGMGIRANDEDFLEWLLKEWKNDRDESDLYTVLLYSLGGEREINGVWKPLSDDVYTFDTEYICDGSDYEDIIKRLAEITKGEFPISDIKVIVDHDNSTANLSFEHKGVKYDWKLMYENDWFDGNVITKMNSILQEQGSKKFFYNSSGDQNANIFFASEDTVRELNKMVSVPFELV